MSMYLNEILMLKESRRTLEIMYDEQGGDSTRWVMYPDVETICLLVRGIRNGWKDIK